MRRTTPRPALGRLAPALLAVSLLALAACGDDGDDDASTEPGPDEAADEATDGAVDEATDEATDDEATDEATAGGAAGGSVTVGGANFTEMLIMQEVYAALLRDAGYDVEIVSADNREIYAQALIDGDIDVVPEYAATMAEYLNREANGPDASPIASSDPQATVEAMRPIAEGLGLVVLEPAEAADQNGFAVSQEFADENGLSTLSDLSALGQPVVLAAVEECPERPFCQPGLEETYGLEITEVLPLGFGSPQAKQAVADGQAQLVLTGTTDATLPDFGLVLLEDDQGLQQADNLVPVVNATAAEDQALVDALNQLADVLTTEDLTDLNRQVDAERQQPADVATAYLEEQGLIGG
jgi:osmoprotectant transport system substrate-binding protein